MQRRTSRYPTRSTVNRSQNNTGSGVSALPTTDLRPQRTRSQVQDRQYGGVSGTTNGHDFHQQRLTNHHSSHQTGATTNNAHHAFSQMFRNHHQANNQQQHHQLMGNGSMSMLNPVINNPAGVYRPPTYTPTYSMPIINEVTLRQTGIKFIKLNSYDDVKVLIKPRGINMGGPTMFQVNDVANFLRDDNFRVFLRFCKYSSTLSEQNDCLPKSFNLIINQAAFQVKNKYTFAPYDITSRVSVERNNDVYIKCSLDQNSTEYSEDFYFGLFLVKKVDHKRLFYNFKARNAQFPYDKKHSIDLVKKKLSPDDDDDEIAIVGQGDIKVSLIKVSLLCPLSSTRMKVPARSKYCDHVHCFDAESFININDITPRWKCPHCKIYIKLDDMIVDNLFVSMLRDAPPDVVEAEIYPDGNFEYVQESKPNISSFSFTNGISKSDSSTGKRKLEDDTKSSSPVKAQKVDKQIECITLDSDTEDEADSDSTITDSPASNVDANQLANGGESTKEDSDDSDDSEIMIVYEKIAPSTSKSSTPASSSRPSSNSNSQLPPSNSGHQASATVPSSTPSSIPTFTSNSSSASIYNPNSRYTNTNSNNFESHRSASQGAYSSQSSNPIVNNQSVQPSSNDVIDMYNNMFKYGPNNIGNMNAFPQSSSNTSTYGMNSIRNVPTSNVNSYIPQSNMFSNVGSTATSSQSIPNVSSQSLMNYQTQPSTSTNFMNNFMSSSMSSGSFNAPSTSTQPMDLTATLANMKTDSLPDFNEPLDFNWFPGSKDTLDFHRCDSSDSRSSTAPPSDSPFHPSVRLGHNQSDDLRW